VCVCVRAHVCMCVCVYVCMHYYTRDNNCAWILRITAISVHFNRRCMSENVYDVCVCVCVMCVCVCVMYVCGVCVCVCVLISVFFTGKLPEELRYERCEAGWLTGTVMYVCMMYDV